MIAQDPIGPGTWGQGRFVGFDHLANGVRFLLSQVISVVYHLPQLQSLRQVRFVLF